MKTGSQCLRSKVTRHQTFRSSRAGGMSGPMGRYKVRKHGPRCRERYRQLRLTLRRLCQSIWAPGCPSDCKWSTPGTFSNYHKSWQGGRLPHVRTMLLKGATWDDAAQDRCHQCQSELGARTCGSQRPRRVCPLRGLPRYHRTSSAKRRHRLPRTALCCGQDVSRRWSKTAIADC